MKNESTDPVLCSTVVLTDDLSVDMDEDGLEVTEFFSPNGIKPTGSGPKPMTHTRGVLPFSQ